MQNCTKADIEPQQFNIHKRGATTYPGGGTQKSFIQGGSAPRSNPLPFDIPFFQKRNPFRIPFIGKRHPFHIPSEEDLGINR